jgi:hypothetical protein
MAPGIGSQFSHGASVHEIRQAGKASANQRDRGTRDVNMMLLSLWHTAKGRSDVDVGLLLGFRRRHLADSIGLAY